MATPPQGQGLKVSMNQLKQGIDLKQLMESEHGPALRQSLNDIYAEKLSGFTEKGLTVEVLWARYNEFQGLCSVLDHMGHTMSIAVAAVIHQRMAKQHVDEFLGESGGS